MKTKLYKQLLVAALSLLMVVPAMAADVANQVVIHLQCPQTAAQVGFEVYSQTDGYTVSDTPAIFYIKQQPLRLMLKSHMSDGWEFENWIDANGTVISNLQYTIVTINQAGEYTYTANVRFQPRNPGYLPMGTYDLSTGTLTVFTPQYGSLMTNFYALAEKYNLPSQGKHHYDMPDQGQGNYNPLNELILQGYVGDGWTVREMLYGSSIQILDLTQTQFNVYDYDQGAFLQNVVPTDLIYDQPSLTTIKLGADITAIQNNAFQAVTGLTDVYCYAENVPTIYPSSFTFVEEHYYYEEEDTVTPAEPAIVNLHVPATAINAYLNDSIWSSMFNIVAMATSTTANLAVYPDFLIDGMYMKINQVGTSDEMTVLLNPSQTRYDMMNLEKNADFCLRLYSPLGFRMDSIVVPLTADTAVHLMNRAPLGDIPARVFVDTAEITNQCVISWFDNTGLNLLATGDRSPLLPMEYNAQVKVMPLGELATYVEPKDTFVINTLAHNGLWINLDKKAVGGEDTVRTQTGALLVTIAGNVDNTVGLLYDSIGNLLGKQSIEQMNLGAVFGLPEVPVGCYTVVLMKEGKYSTLSRLDLYSQMGLSANTDYVREDFCIVANQVTRVSVNGIPEEPQITDFLSADAHFFASKTEVMVAGQLILTAEVGFLEEYIEDISNLFYVIDLPENVQLVENSVMVGNSSVNYSFQNGQLRVGTGLANLANKNATALRFCVLPAAEGDFYPSASVEFNYRNQPKAQPISNTFFTAKAITIQAPAYLIEKSVTVTGFAPAYATVNIVTAQNETIGTGTSNALGKYNIHCLFSASGSRTLVLHAEASTAIISGIISDTCSTYYDADAAAPKEIQMTHYNKWYRKNMTIIWNLDSCTTNQKYYYYYLAADFTFRAKFVGSVDTVAFVAIGQDGSRTSIPATHGGNNEWYATEHIQTYKVPVRVDLVYGYNNTLASYETCKSVGAIADPSGYVYEAVSSNRLQDVTAAAYMKQDEGDLPVLWDATDYDQVNPMLTDEAGGYAWDVPAALWQVRFTKPGYEPAQTKWLPVPPPQMEVNMPLVRLSAPVVKSIKAYEDNITIQFDRYMMPEDLDTAMIHITAGGNAVSGTFTLLDKEARMPGDSVIFASKVRFTPSTNLSTATVNVRFDKCRSYANVPMAITDQTADVVAEVKSFGQLDTIHVTVGQSAQCEVFALPGFAAAGKTIRFDAAGSDYFMLNATSAVLGSNGGTTLTLQGKLPGTTELRIWIEGTNLETFVPVVVIPQAQPIVTSVETVPAATDDTTVSAQKVLRNGILYIEHNGNCFTTTGMLVK